MDTYLNTTIQNLKSGNYSKLTIVLGNESCDLDSAVSSIVYALFSFWQYTQIKCKVCTRSSRDESASSTYKDDIFVPVLNVDRDDFDLKTEVVYLLRQHNITAEMLVFRDDFDLQQITSKPGTTVVLVDHHILAKRDQFLADMVTEIIDHRPVDRRDWKYSQDTRSSIELVGSCCSLVAQRIRSLSKLLSKETDFFHAYPATADMLLAGIILDTVNFSKDLNKATSVDIEMATFLEAILKTKHVEETRKAKLESLVEARKAVSHLTADQLLRKDVKIIRDVLVPSFPILVEEWLALPGAMAAVVAALRRRECSLAVLLGMSLKVGLRRDVAVFADLQNRSVQTQLAKHLQEWKGPDLRLVPEEIHNKTEFIYFRQNNLSASRKQYMPAITNFLEIREPKQM